MESNEKYISKPTKHTISLVSPNEKSLELRVLLLERLDSIDIKSGERMTQFLVADSTGSIRCNFFGQGGSQLQPGDIVYLASCYAHYYKETTLTLYSGKKGQFWKVGEFFMLYNETPYLGDSRWERDPRNPSLYRRPS